MNDATHSPAAAAEDASVDLRPRTAIWHFHLGIGDLVWHLPYIRAVAAQSRGGQVSVIARPSTRADQLLKLEPCVEQVITCDHKPRRSERRTGLHDTLAGKLEFIRLLRAQRFERVDDFSKNRTQAWMAWQAGIPQRAGYGLRWGQQVFLNLGPPIQPYRGPSSPVCFEATAFMIAQGVVAHPLVPQKMPSLERYNSISRICSD